MFSKVRIFLLVAFALLLTGCISSGSLIENSSSEKRPYYGHFYSVDGLSSNANNLLSNLMLMDEYKEDPANVIVLLEHRYQEDPSADLLSSLSSMAWNVGLKFKDKDPDFAASAYASALLYSYHYLTYSDHPADDPYNIDRFMIMRTYNQAQTELLAYLKERNLLLHDAYQLATLSGKTLVFKKPIIDIPEKSFDPNSLFICADYRTKNLFHQSYRFGVGTPLVLVFKDKVKKDSTRIHSGRTMPLTLVTHIGRIDNTKYTAQMEYIDVLQTEKITFKSNPKVSFPLELDFSTPLAFLTQTRPLYNFLSYTLNPGATQDMQGLYFLQPYDPKRIPVLFVHGLLSNPRTWVQMINTLQNDPILRKYYQFWGYSYSSGNPILISADQLRDSLDNTMKLLESDADATDMLDRMVVVGHSMGGLLSKTLIMNSDKNVIKKQLNLDWDEIVERLDDDKREDLSDILFTEPKPYVKRVVFIAVPHRGASLATSFIGRLGSSLITIPTNFIQRTITLQREIIRLIGQDRGVNIDLLLEHNGIVDLQPDNMVLTFLNNAPLDKSIPYHSIIGNNEQANVPSGTDGIVPYKSSHLDDAKSELVVKSGHSAHRHPLAIMEIRRILLEHLQGYRDTRQEQVKEEFFSK